MKTMDNFIRRQATYHCPVQVPAHLRGAFLSLKPSTRDELLLAHGMGPTKVERYGDGFLDVVRQMSGPDGAPRSTPSR